MIRISLLLAVTITITNCYTMDIAIPLDQSPKPIILKNGLLTEIPARLVTFKYKGTLTPRRYIRTDESEKYMTLAMLINTQGALLNGEIIAPFTSMFCPTVIKIEKDNSFANLGLFSKIHKEAKEACRSKKAAFYPYQQGAIIYSLNRKFKLDFFHNKKQEIERMIDDSKEEKITLLLPVFYYTK